MKSFVCAIVVAAVASTVSAASISPAVGSDPCTQGPSFWCSSKAHAKMCGFPVTGCKKYCRNPQQYPQIRKGDICSPPKPKPQPVGGDPCTWGPSYWCASWAHAKKCGISVARCQTYCDNAEMYPDIQRGDICRMPAAADYYRRDALVGSNPCTYGPSFWCASTANAKQCGFPVEDCNKYCANATEYPDIQTGDICTPPAPVVGSNPCTYGPSYWCASTANAKQCGFPVTDCQEYCANATEYPDIQSGDICTVPPAPPVVGSNSCTYGPSYWCASAANAKECGVKTSECKKYCSNTKEYPDIHKGSLCKSLLA